jgi:membrane fusion protein, peptide pheromone/bacteriocin exporter
MDKKKLFPTEIVEFTAESHFVENNKRFRLIYVGLVLAICLAIILLPLIEVTVSTQGRGVVRTVYENIDLQASIYGQVKYSNIHEGKPVQKGDTLLLLRADRVDEQINHYQTQIRENKEFADDLNALLSGGFTVRSPRYMQEASQYQAKLEEMRVTFQMIEKEHDLAKHLYDEKVTAEMEYLQVKNQYEVFQSQLDLFQKQTKNSWEAERTRILRESTQIESSIRQLQEEKTQFIITAPATGIVSHTTGIQAGSFVNPGQILAQISPDDELIVECYISPKDIGFIFIEQPVRIQVDAFNYNQWGLVHGEVTHVSEDIISFDSNPVFRVRCKIQQHHLALKTGHKGFLKKGMTITSRFDLTKRSLFQLLFDKVDNWLNPKLKNA